MGTDLATQQCLVHCLHFVCTLLILLPGQVIEAGANAIVAGSAVFKAKSYRDGECQILLCCSQAGNPSLRDANVAF
jgi:hypothetical protein